MSFHVAIGEANEVVIRHSNNSTPIICKALLIELDSNGQPNHIILDRLITDFATNNNIDAWSIKGCFVSELIRKI